MRNTSPREGRRGLQKIQGRRRDVLRAWRSIHRTTYGQDGTFHPPQNIPGELLSIFKKGRKTATEWESLITQAVLSKSTFEDEEEERRPRDEDTENDDGVDEDFGETSTIGSGAGDGGGDDIEINFEWDYDEDEGGD